jgi:hypothetical protein
MPNKIDLKIFPNITKRMNCNQRNEGLLPSVKTNANGP